MLTTWATPYSFLHSGHECAANDAGNVVPTRGRIGMNARQFRSLADHRRARPERLSACPLHSDSDQMIACHEMSLRTNT
jgi:hypothetical protein